MVIKTGILLKSHSYGLSWA